MKYEDILHELAPCGLSCRKCVAFGAGDVRTAEQHYDETKDSPRYK